MQNPYEIDIRREIVDTHFETEISYRFTKDSNKRYKITDNPDQAMELNNHKCNQNSLKRKIDDISEELPPVIVCGKRRFEDR
jgi:hypothetical protein